MSEVTIHRIIGMARQESEEMHQYFVGAEHLFLALTRLKGGVTSEVLEQRQLLGYFWENMAQEAFAEDDPRPFPDIRHTPRTERILNAAYDLVERNVQPEDRALLLAVLNECDSLPIRILEAIGADISDLRDDVLSWTSSTPPIPPGVPLEVEDPTITLNVDQITVLRSMFSDAKRIYVKRALQGGFGGSTVLLVQTIRNGLLTAPAVVKIDDRQTIHYENMRYEQWVREILPPNTSRIEDLTSPPDSRLGGIRYTFVRQSGADAPVNLRQFAAEHSPPETRHFIRHALYEAYRPYWWGQQNQIYHFQVWQEYELLLPPALVLQVLPMEAANATTRVLHPGGSWSYKGGVPVGEVVILEKFVTQKVRPGILQVSAGAESEASSRASRVEIRGIDFDQTPYLRGQKVTRLVGRVLRTRDDILQQQVQTLEPDFDILADNIPHAVDGRSLPNPLRYYARLLERWVDGRLTPIHGDLHTGNILMGPAGDAWLIDFEWTRQGHTLFDWAVLEINLITDLVVPLLEESWESCWQVINVLDHLNRYTEVPAYVGRALADAIEPAREVRRIARELLAPGALWSEYFVALSLCAIRVPSWSNRPLAARRLTFLMSALYMDAARTQDHGQLGTDTINKTATDLRQV